MGKIKTTVHIESDMLQALRKLSEDDERPMAYHHNKALRAYGPIKKLTGKDDAPFPRVPAIAEIDDSEFEQVWELYEKKGNRKTSKLRFEKMSCADKESMYNHLPEYLLSTPDKQFRKGFEVYINQECWNDEVIHNTESRGVGFVEKHTNDEWADGL